MSLEELMEYNGEQKRIEYEKKLNEKTITVPN